MVMEFYSVLLSCAENFHKAILIYYDKTKIDSIFMTV